MSFILDALRKSESERQREVTPRLSHAPLAAGRRRTPGWTLILIAALSLALGALALAWWQSVRLSGAAPGAILGAARQEPAPAAAERSAAGPRATDPSATSPSATGPRATVAGPTPAAGSARTAGSGAGTDPGALASAGEGQALRPFRELAEIDPALPTFTLEFVAHNRTNPAAGSAWINGSQYRPGERVEGGPELAEVRTDSVVLHYRGQRFLLEMR